MITKAQKYLLINVLDIALADCRSIAKDRGSSSDYEETVEDIEKAQAIVRELETID